VEPVVGLEPTTDGLQNRSAPLQRPMQKSRKTAPVLIQSMFTGLFAFSHYNALNGRLAVAQVLPVQLRGGARGGLARAAQLDCVAKGATALPAEPANRRATNRAKTLL
jgi:hypothetical protein